MTDIVIASAARTPSGCGFAKQSKRDAGNEVPGTIGLS